jgi:multicomponent Na+:H+ antiporter subunit D
MCCVGEDAALPLLIALPLLAAALSRLPVVHATRLAPDAVAIAASTVTTLVAGWVAVRAATGPVVHHLGGWEPLDRLPIGIPLVADPLAAGFAALTGALVTAVLVHLAASGARGGGLTHVLTALLLAAANGFVLAGDLFTMFVFLELLSITVYAITAGKTDDPAALPAALNMAVTSTVGAVMLLSGVGLLHAQLGSPNLAAVGEALAATGWDAGTALAVGLITTGLAVKAGLVPFHFAHADLHTATTVQHAGLFGAVLLPLGLYGIARIHGVVLDGHPSIGWVLVAGGALTALVAGAMSLLQNHLKRLLAFSSVSHLGIAAAGLGVASVEATSSVALYVLGHAPVKLGLLLTAGAILHRLGALQVAELAGRWRQVPLATLLLAVGGLALAGAPPSGLYAGKAALSEAAVAAGLAGVVPLLYVAAVLTGAAALRIVVHLVTGWSVPPDPHGHVAEAEHEPEAHTPRTFVWLPALLVTIGVVLPLVPGSPEVVNVAGGWFHDREAYGGAVLDGLGPTPPDLPAPPSYLGAESLLTGTLAGVAALLGGVAAARWRGRRRAGRLGAPVRMLRGLHTAHVGDYTAWLTVGAAAIVGWTLVSG